MGYISIQSSALRLDPNSVNYEMVTGRDIVHPVTGFGMPKSLNPGRYWTVFLPCRVSYQSSIFPSPNQDQSTQSKRAASSLQLKPLLTLIAQDLTILARGGYHNGFMEVDVLHPPPPPSRPRTALQPAPEPSQRQPKIHLHIVEILCAKGLQIQRLCADPESMSSPGIPEYFL